MGTPSSTETHNNADVACTVRTARKRTTKANDDSAARPMGDSSMNG